MHDPKRMRFIQMENGSTFMSLFVLLPTVVVLGTPFCDPLKREEARRVTQLTKDWG